MDDEQQRSAPVIVITGTPGTGKSTTAGLLVDASPIPLKHVNVGELVKSQGLHEGYDDEWQSYLVDDDKVTSQIITFTTFTITCLRSSTNSNLSWQKEASSSTGTHVAFSPRGGSTSWLYSDVIILFYGSA